VVLYIFVVAVLNLGLGFAVALYAARRYRELVALASESARPATTPGAVAVEEALPPAEQPAQGKGEAQGVASLKTGKEDPVKTSLGDEQPAVETPREAQAPADIEPGSEPEISPSEASVDHFKDEVEKYHQELIRLDNAFRECQAEPDAGTLKSHIDSLQGTSEEYLASREQAHQAFQELHAQREEFRGLNDDLWVIMQQQGAQISDTNHVIESLGPDANPREGSRQMVGQTAKLLRVNHDLRDTLEEASAIVARIDGRLESIDEAGHKDPLTKLATRAALEASLATLWEKDPHRARPLCAAMIDIDQFGRLNERYGQEVCDRILRAIAQFLNAESRNHSIAARFSGQQFMLLFPDVDLRFTTNVVERIRQTIETAHFEYGKEDIRVTVSCAVVQATPGDTSDALYARAGATLHQAKRYGRNRTFLHEGKHPTPVIPPNFTVEEKSITI